MEERESGKDRQRVEYKGRERKTEIEKIEKARYR